MDADTDLDAFHAPSYPVTFSKPRNSLSVGHRLTMSSWDNSVSFCHSIFANWTSEPSVTRAAYRHFMVSLSSVCMIMFHMPLHILVRTFGSLARKAEQRRRALHHTPPRKPRMFVGGIMNTTDYGRGHSSCFEEMKPSQEVWKGGCRTWGVYIYFKHTGINFRVLERIRGALGIRW